MTRILALDSSLGRCSAGVVTPDGVLAEQCLDVERGQAGLLPAMVQAVIAASGIPPDALDLVAVTVGPGSFTGIRSGLALAHGIALGLGIPVIGVTVGEALAESSSPADGRLLWSTVDSRAGRVFIETAGAVQSFALDCLPAAPGPIAVAGPAAAVVAAALAARGDDVVLSGMRYPAASMIAAAAARRHAGRSPPRASLPLYVDAPEARLPAGGLRPPPSA